MNKFSEHDQLERYSAIFDQSPIAIEFYNAEGRLIKVNKACLELFGVVDSAEILGFKMFEDPNITDEVKEKLLNNETVRLDADFDFEKVKRLKLYKTTCSGIKNLDWSIAPLINENLVTGYVMQIQDITERKQAEQQFERLFRANPALMALTTLPERKFFDVNESFLNTLGYSKNEIIGKTSAELSFFPNQEHTTLIAEKLKMGRVSNIELKVRHKDGTFLHGVFSGEIITHQGQKCLLSVMTDITERKRLENDLREAAQKMRGIFDQTFQFIGMLTPDGILVEVNRTALEFSGISIDSVLGKNFWDTPWWTHSAELQDKLRKAVVQAASGQVIRFDATHIAADGSLRHIDFSLKPIKDETGKVIFLIPEGHDITEMKRMEESARQDDKLRVFGQLAGGIAHDFNNMLTGIMGYAEMMKDQGFDESSGRRYANNIFTAAKRSAHLVKDLLSFSRKSKMIFLPMSIHGLIVETVELLTHSLDKKFELRQVLNARNVMVLGDMAQLQNALLNLATNARDAMENGGVITYSTNNVVLNDEINNLHGEFIQIDVTDNGCGMTKEVLDKVFEPFFTTKDIGKGTGLGVPAVYGIMKSHQGHVEFKSEVGIGTKVCLFIPVDKGKIENDNDVTEVKERTVRILAIDDEVLVRGMLKEILEVRGHQVTCHGSGETGIDYYKTNWRDIDLVLLDMNMPEMTGNEVLEELKQINPMVKCVWISGYNINEYVNVKDETFYFIQKPFDGRMLGRKIKEVCG